jgi:hypothetical protein
MCEAKRLELCRCGYLKPSPEDLYHMHAYAAKFRCEHPALICPRHNGLSGSRETILELPVLNDMRPRVAMVCINIGGGEFIPYAESQRRTTRWPGQPHDLISQEILLRFQASFVESIRLPHPFGVEPESPWVQIFRATSVECSHAEWVRQKS